MLPVATCAFVITFLGFPFSELTFKFVNSYVYALINIFTCLGNNKNLTMLCPCNHLYTGITAGTRTRLAVDNYFNPIDTIVIPGKFGSLLLGMFSNRLRDINMFTSYSKKQSRSP